MRTYQIDLTLQVDAVNAKQAQRLVRLVAKDIASGRRRPHCPGASGVVHAAMDLFPREILPALQFDDPALTAVPPVTDAEDEAFARWADDGGAACAA